ncbi:MAG: class I adenylate-forming enzyme family protein [Actinomycetota bacterium]
MADRFRSAIAQGEGVRTAADLDRLASAVAAVVSGSIAAGRIAIATADRSAAVAALFGAWDAGRLPVIIGETPPRPGSIEARQLVDRLVTSAPSMVLADDGYQNLLTGAGFIAASVNVTDLGPLRAWCPSEPPVAPNPPGAALLVFTSGSTGTQKAVVLSTEALNAIAATNRLVYRLTVEDRFLSALPLTHLAGLTNVLAAVAGGAEVLVAPPVVFGHEIRSFTADHRVTVAGLVPYQLHQMFGRTGRAEGCGQEPTGAASDRLDALRLIVSSGSRLSGHVAAATTAAVPGATLVNAYGLTEAFRSFAARVDPDAPGDLGQPVLGVSARLVVPESSIPAEPGAVGEIQLRGHNRYDGYWQPDGTVEPPPLWLPTGDLATVDHRGRYHLIGRQRTYVNVGGHKEAVETIEEVLEPTAPGRLAVAQALDDRGLEQVVVVAEAGAGVRLGDLRRAARPLAPALRPTAVVEVDHLPRTAVGKVDRTSLIELAQTATGTGAGQ